MNDFNSGSNPDFFGKDRFVPFIGTVEDVDDPKRAGRVKVRCIGWHPKEKTGDQGLKTEDLPWGKVGMPATHNQQARIGGKHGLLPGSWVMGFFLDGEEANQPFILSTFNFTPKTADQDLRSKPKGTNGKLSQEDQAFDKMASPLGPNISVKTPDEEGQEGFSNEKDISGDVVCDASNDFDTGTDSRSSVSHNRMTKQKFKVGDQGNAESQIYPVTIADGLCGTIAHGRDDIQKKMKEQLPSQLSRFSFNDSVWNRYTGQFMDLNGIYLQLAMEISNGMKQPAQSKKSVKEEKNRNTKSDTIKAKPDRDGPDREEIDETTTKKDDLFHALFGESMIDTLLGTVNQMLKNLNNSGQGSSSDSNQQQSGSTPTTSINNNEAICLTDTLLDNINTLTDAAIELGSAASNSGSNSEDSNLIASILGSLTDVMKFPLTQKFAVKTDIFNRAGSRSMDTLNKERGCIMERNYVTNMGTMASLMGFDMSGAVGSAFGSNARASSPSPNGGGNFDLTQVGFGGYPGVGTGGNSSELCEEATAETVPDPVYDDIVNNTVTDDSNIIGQDPFEGGFVTIPVVDGPVVVRPEIPGFATQPGFLDPEPGTPGTPGADVGAGDGIIGEDGQTDAERSARTGTGATPTTFVTTTSSTTTTTDNVTQTLGSITSPGGFDKISVPRGFGAIVNPMSLPSQDADCAKNFVDGIPTTMVIFDPGKYYYYNNPNFGDRTFPSLYIPTYNGTPVPVVDRTTGELVAVVTECKAFSLNPRPKCTVIPDDSPIGIVSDDIRYDIRLGGFFIENTGFNYTNPTIEIYDKDNGTNNNASATVVTKDSRIVAIEVINTGTGFRRIPEVIIRDETGYNAKVRPIMSVITRSTTAEIVTPVESIQCPSKNQLNLL